MMWSNWKGPQMGISEKLALKLCIITVTVTDALSQDIWKTKPQNTAIKLFLWIYNFSHELICVCVCNVLFLFFINILKQIYLFIYYVRNQNWQIQFVYNTILYNKESWAIMMSLDTTTSLQILCIFLYPFGELCLSP